MQYRFNLKYYPEGTVLVPFFVYFLSVHLVRCHFRSEKKKKNNLEALLQGKNSQIKLAQAVAWIWNYCLGADPKGR